MVRRFGAAVMVSSLVLSSCCSGSGSLVTFLARFLDDTPRPKIL